MILAGDIGGTKTNLALYDWTAERVEPLRLESFHSGDYTSLEDILVEFLAPPRPPSRADSLETEEGSQSQQAEERPAESMKLTAACFGIAGPVIDNRCQTTNLPWIVDGSTIAKQFEIPRVQLLNDLEATAYGVLWLRSDELEVLNAGHPPKKRQALALIAAGTGLGEAILFWDGKSYRPMPSEGGHADFAPNNDQEMDLLRYLRGQYLHVSYERILSGPGLHAVYEFLRDTKKNEPTWLAEKIKVGNPAAEIAQAGLQGQAEIAKQALELFATIYGAEAGNLALKALSLDGVYVGGGIAPKLITKLQDGAFMKAFTNKGRYKRLMTHIPVKVIMNQQTALLGAASVAAALSLASMP
ncbi:glucokinase [Candidatus Nitrospira nitrificans]|uniref:Glucokinase n=1 Tax=Candidatus Nitrospira nitrificans TaxID=1742973 RepID=A0A0S4LF66_9BACT|nr:glucokinase [Candidatus Nitrospira nitrificans]CUS34628.1 Glucokinase [Candidatus Nitrospira nitrificans]